MAGVVPRVIVLALGAGALGGADALRLLLAFAGQGPVVDIAICVFVIGMFAAQLLGAMLLARFLRKARTGAGAGSAAPAATAAADCFAKMTLLVSMGVAFIVTACLVVVSGALGPIHLLLAVLGVCAAAAAVPCIMPLLRVFGEAGNPDGAAPAARATERFADAAGLLQLTGVRLVAVGLLAVPFIPPGGLGGLSLFPSYTNMFVGVAVATVVGTTLIVLVSRRPRNAARAGGAATPTPATDKRRFAKPTCLAVVSFTVACVIAAISYAYSSAGRKSDSGKHACSV